MSSARLQLHIKLRTINTALSIGCITARYTNLSCMFKLPNLRHTCHIVRISPVTQGPGFLSFMTTSNGKKSSGRYVHSTSSSRKATVKQRNQTIKHVAVRRTKRSRLRLTVPGARDEDLLVGGSDIEDIDPASEGNEDDNDVFVDALEDFNALENSEEAVDPLEELVKAMELEFEELERQLLDEQSKQPKAPNEKVKKAPARPLKDWIPHRQRLVDQLLAQDGLGESASIPDCQLCGVKPGTMKCRDCFGMALLCQECTLNAHLRLPLHRILVCPMFLTFSWDLIMTPPAAVERGLF